MLLRLGRLAFALGASLMLVGCDGGYYGPSVTSTVVPAKPKFVYTGNYRGSLSGYSVNAATGVLTPLAGFPFALGVVPTRVTHDPQNRFLIAADIGASKLHVLAIDGTTGTLTEVQGSPYGTVIEPSSVVVDPSGNHVYVTDQQTNQIGAYSLSANGALTPIQGEPFTTTSIGSPIGFSSGTASALTDAAGKFLYVIDSIGIYTFGISSSSGALTLLQNVSGPTAGQGLALDPAGRYIYAVGAGQDSILTYNVSSSSGLLAQAFTSPMGQPNGAYTITVSPNGKFAYTIENTDYLDSYLIQNGSLTLVGQSLAGINAYQIAIDPTSTFLYAPQFCQYCFPLYTGPANVVNELSIGSTGMVTVVAGSPVASGGAPTGITIISQ